MTRINSDLDPKVLLDQHLMAEYRELPMVHAALRRSLRTKSVESVVASIPPAFTLNKGHVTFFYDKLVFLQGRYERLKDELFNRGFDLDENRKLYDYKTFPKEFQNNWSSSKRDDMVVVQRILEKHQMKPSWYKYWSDPMSAETYKLLLTGES